MSCKFRDKNPPHFSTNEVNSWVMFTYADKYYPIFGWPCENVTDILRKNALQHRRYGSWWRYQMEIFSALLAICAGNSPVSGEFPTQRPVTGRFDVFFDLHPNKRLSKQWWGWWFETISCPLWRHHNDMRNNDVMTRKCLPYYRPFE